MVGTPQFSIRFSSGFKGTLWALGFLSLVGLVTATRAQAQNYTVSGNHVLDPNAQIFYFHGVDRSGFESSAFGDGHFTQTDFNNIATWKANTVRIATNQDFLLSDSSCFDANYLSRLDAAVTAAHNAGMNVIFDLHWNDPAGAGHCASGQQNMADARSLTFWQTMANHYKNDPKVFFELYNEPHSISWSCWLNGCSPWVGMQQMYNTVRNAGFNNLVIMGGLNFAYDLSGVPSNRPSGVNIVFATHPYDFSGKQPSDWHTGFGFLTATDPVVATEFGDFNCTTGYVTSALNYFDAPDGNAANKMGWTGWAWNAPGSCGFPSIIADFNGTPSTMGQPEHDRLLSYASAPSPPAPPTNLTATAGNAQVSLSWTGSTGATSYNVKRSTTSGGPYTTVATGVTSTSFTDTGLTNGTTYFYVVSAVNSNGESGNSNQASATPMPPAQADFTISASPGTQTVTAGSSTTYTVSIGAVSGFTGTVSLSVSGLPSGATGTFNPSSVSVSGSSTLTVSTTSSTATGVFTVTITGTSGSLSHTATPGLIVQAPGSVVYQISAGNPTGAGAIAPYVADEFFSGGTVVLHSVTVDTSKVTSPAPQAVYQYERYGSGTSFTYTLPNLTAGASYTVRLHFAETFFTSTGQRLFNVSINGTQVLTNFDIVAAAAGANTAVIEQFAATADSFGDIGIQFTLGSVNNPKVDGIEVINAMTGLPAAPTNLAATGGNAQVSLTWTGSTGATSYNVKRSTTSGGPYSNIATGVTSTSFTNTGLTNGTTYFYVVSAVNSSAESPNSNQASATPTGTPDFTISASPSSQTVTAGNSTTYTVSISAMNGFSGPVNLSVIGLPSGATGSFNPTSVTGSGTSTLTVSTTTSTATGTFALTITGTSGSLSHNTTASLTVNAAGGGTGNAHSGTWSVKGVLTSTASYKNFSQVPNPASNSTYVASIWIKGTGSVQLQVKAGNWGSNIMSVRCNATSTWQLCTTPSFSTGSNTKLTFVVQDQYGTAGTVYLDDTFLGISGGSNILTNPGFESGNTGWSVNGTVFTIGQF